jgi:hypothetical protein
VPSAVSVTGADGGSVPGVLMDSADPAATSFVQAASE